MTNLPPHPAKILVIGDIIIDEYINGTVSRMSPEDSSVPVLDFSSREYRLGGAGNVAANIKSLSSHCEVSLAGIASSFTINHLILPKGIELLNNSEISSKMQPAKYDEIIKTRVFDWQTNKQLIRIDNLKTYPSSEISVFSEDLSYHNFNEFDAIVVSDYNKGSVNETTIKLLESYRGPVFIDTKKVDLSIWQNLKEYCIKINELEYSKYCDFVCWGGDHTMNGVLVVTKGNNGCELREKDNTITKLQPQKKIANPDVCGAGDVFLAGLAVRYMETLDFKEACEYANKVAGISVTKKGTSIVRKEDVDGV
jgi:rfaE bifunctional protein kinase chain/domain